MADDELKIDILDNQSFYNYETLFSEFLKIVPALDKDEIDYQLAGNFSIYVKYHEHIQSNEAIIDLNLNEKDLPKFQKICESFNLTISDKRLNSFNNSGSNLNTSSDITVLLDNTPFIKLVLFERLVDGTLIMKNYYHDINYLKVKEDIFSNKLAKIIFEKNSVLLDSYKVYIVCLEYLYIQNGKKYDFNSNLAVKIDKQKKMELTKLLDDEMITETNIVDPLTISNIIDTEYEHTKNEIQQIVLDSSYKDYTETQSLEFLKTKQLHKITEVNESGFISKYAIVVSILMILIIILIILIVLK